MKTRLIPTAVALLLSVASTQGAAQTTTASAADATDAVVTGSISSVSLQSVLRPQAQDVGKSIQLFAIALVPTAQGDKAYVKTQSGWQAVLSGRPIPALSQALAAEEHPIALTQFDDARGLTGTRVYVGYGLQGAAADSAWQEMIQSGRYRLVYTFPAEETAAAYSLQASTEGSLKTWFADAMGKNSNFAYGTVTDDKITTGIPAPSPVPTPAPSPAPSIGGANLSAGGPIFSGTTLQESGVDEADLVKTDGTYVWSLVAPTTGLSTALQRHSFSSTTPPALTPVDTVKLAFGKGARISGMFLDGTGKQLAVVGETGSISGGIYSAWFSPMSWVSGSTEVALVDTASPTQMAQKRHLQFSATLIGSRRIGSTLYLVLRNYPKIVGFDPYWYTADKVANQAALDAANVGDFLPQLSIDNGKPAPVVSASSCYTQGDNANKTADIITMVAIDLANATHRHAARCFTGGTEAFYMSEQSLYLATTRTTYTGGSGYPTYNPRTNTDIHKFALNGLDMAYKGSGSVTGHLGFDQNRKSFRMGEHEGALRVITQSNPTWFGWGRMAMPVGGVGISTGSTVLESPGHLSILREANGTLALAGELPNARRPTALGKPGEQLYASRFLGQRGYLVTYRLTDPLYVLDLSNPADPFVAGELQVDGYSDYLFPLSETLLLGVGKDAVSDGNGGDGRFAWYQGVKLSLIDVSNPAKPVEAARSIVGKRGTDAAVLHDHHGIALAFRPDNTVRVSLPVSLHETPSPYTYNSGAPTAYYDFTRTELQKFDIHLGAKSLSARTPLLSALPNVERSIAYDRSIIWNDQVHYYQAGEWKSSAW